jgi:hypothetical protein
MLKRCMRPVGMNTFVGVIVWASPGRSGVIVTINVTTARQFTPCCKKNESVWPLKVNYLMMTYPISVSSMRIIEAHYVDLAVLNNPVVAHQKTSHRPQEDSISGHEVEKNQSARHHKPWYEKPAANNRAEYSSATDVDPSRQQGCSIVGEGDGICGDVAAYLSQDPKY